MVSVKITWIGGVVSLLACATRIDARHITTANPIGAVAPIHLSNSTADGLALLNERQNVAPALCYPVNGQPWGALDAGLASDAYQTIWHQGTEGGTGFYEINAGCCINVACYANPDDRSKGNCKPSSEARLWNQPEGTSGVFLCNDADDHLELECVILAWYVQAIMGACKFPGTTTGGQMFDEGNFNVIVGTNFNAAKLDSGCNAIRE